MFFESFEKFGHKPAVIDEQGALSYVQLDEKIEGFIAQLPRQKSLVFLLAEHSSKSLIAYLACLRAGHCTMLLTEDMAEPKLTNLMELYSPDVLIRKGKVSNLTTHYNPIMPACALLLSTSGSTGAAKQVALSFSNLHSNAHSISEYLPIVDSDKAMMTLPMFYAYGLSVVNSHLLKGACLVFTSYAFVNREFWEAFEKHAVTSFAGVPHSYEMLLRLGFTRKELPSLRYFTQAGGKLASQKVRVLGEYAQQYDKQFFVMYGQTEATARMAFLDSKKVLTKPDCIGQAIPDGVLFLRNENGERIEQADESGELCYCGPNVMMGYVSDRQGLEQIESAEELQTGDLAYMDSEGDFYIVGRKKRMIKVFGQRISLDDVEELVAQHGIESYCCGDDNRLVVAVAAQGRNGLTRQQVGGWLHLHPSAVDVLEVEALPINDNGKKDYQQIMALVGEK